MRNHSSKLRDLIGDSIKVKELAIKDEELLDKLSTLIEQVKESLVGGGKVIFAGNGGSFADAQHLAGEFVSRFMFDRAPLAGMALSTNGSNMSAIGNDYGYEDVFLRELQALALPGDVFIPISTSGNSKNLVSASLWAKDNNLIVCGFTGNGDGELQKLIDCLKVPSDSVPRIQECHILLGHMLCEIVESEVCSK